MKKEWCVLEINEYGNQIKHTTTTIHSNSNKIHAHKHIAHKTIWHIGSINKITHTHLLPRNNLTHQSSLIATNNQINSNHDRYYYHCCQSYHCLHCPREGAISWVLWVRVVWRRDWLSPASTVPNYPQRNMNISHEKILGATALLTVLLTALLRDEVISNYRVICVCRCVCWAILN